MEGKSIAARPFGFLRLMPSIASSFISLIGILESPLRHHEAPMQYLDTKIRKALCNEFGVNRSFHIVSPVLSTILESFDRADFNHYPVFSFHSRRSRGCSSSIHFKGRRSISCSNRYQESQIGHVYTNLIDDGPLCMELVKSAYSVDTELDQSRDRLTG